MAPPENKESGGICVEEEQTRTEMTKSDISVELVEEGESLTNVNDEIEKWMEDKVDKDGIIKFYDNWTDEYDGLKTDYNGPRLLAEHVASYANKLESLQNLLDVGAGTGFLGMEIKKLLPSNVQLDALDPSEGLLEKAKELNIYTNFYYDYITVLNSTGIKSDLYDVVCCVGTFVPGHLPLEAWYELIRVTRVGGIIGVATRRRFVTEYSGYKDWFSTLEKLEQNNVLQRLEFKTDVKHYMGNAPGVIFVYKKLK